MTDSISRNGFLVVLSRSQYTEVPVSTTNPRYSGIDRVPPYPSEYDEENSVLESYVFGEYKDEKSNLIPTFMRALELHHALSRVSKRSFEIILVCSGPDSELIASHIEVVDQQLGFDIASVQSDYWSIVDDFSKSKWAFRYKSTLNEFGLFSERGDAEEYLNEYRSRQEPDKDSPFEIFYVVQIKTG